MASEFSKRIVIQTMGFVLVATLVLEWLSGASAAELRTWSDKSGQYQLKARLVRLEDEKVVLQREDGGEIRVKLAILSEADQAYVKENASADTNPFASARPRGESNSSRPTQQANAPPADQESRLVKIDWSAVKAVTASPGGEWKFAVAASAVASPARDKPIPLPACSGSVARCQATVNRVCHRVLIGYVFDGVPMGRETGLAMCDLQSGRVHTCYGPGRMLPLALSDSGEQVLVLSTEVGQGSDRVELWSLTAHGVEVVSQWHLHNKDEQGELKVRSAAFLPEGKLATFSSVEQSHSDGSGRRGKDGVSSVEGKLIVWTLTPLKPLFYVLSGKRSLPAVSPDGRHIALAKDRQVAIVDTKAGQIVASATLPEIADPAFAFSPSGARLAALGQDRIHVWDFASGKLDRTIRLMGTQSVGWVMWTSEGQVLNGETLFDVERERKLWQYEGALGVAFCEGACWFVVPGSSNQPSVLLPVKLPHPEALRRLHDTPIDLDFFAVAPGATVRIVVDSIPDAAHRENVRALLARKLQANGCKVGEQSRVELVVVVQRREPEEVYLSKHHFPIPMFEPPPPGTKTYRFQGYDIHLKFTYEGEPIWEDYAPGIPPVSVQLDQGETIEQQLRRSEKPDYEWLQKVEIPKLLTKSWYVDPLGKSQVTTAGLEEVELPPGPKPTQPGMHEWK